MGRIRGALVRPRWGKQGTYMILHAILCAVLHAFYFFNTTNLHSRSPQFDVILCADTLWLYQEHEALAKTCLDCLQHGEESAVYLTYQHHNEHAPTFFAIAKRMGFEVQEEYMMLGWCGRDVETLLELAEEEDMYGPIYVSKMYIPTATDEAAASLPSSTTTTASSSLGDKTCKTADGK